MLLLAMLVGCAGDGGRESGVHDTAHPADVLAVYDFEARDGSDSSVGYAGQVFRHLLIAELDAHVARLTARLDGVLVPQPGDVAAALDFYYHFDSTTSGGVPLQWTSTPAPLQRTFDDVARGKDLAGKIAGNDPANQHADWTTGVPGWDADGPASPEALVLRWFAALDDASVAWAAGDVPRRPDGTPVDSVHVTADGLDLRVLLRTFLAGAVAYSQGTDDYLDEGLDEDHAALVEGEPYTALEHAWDEAFGYFGAARDLPAWTDAATAGEGTRDSLPADGAIDLAREVCWGHVRDAAARDLAAGPDAASDLTAAAWDGFIRGRALLAATRGPLSAGERATLEGYRDQVVIAWETAIAASLVDALDRVLVVVGAPEGTPYAFEAYAADWSELKGRALTLPFNPRATLSRADLDALHAAIGQAPVLPEAGADARAAYAAGLRAARERVAQAHGLAVAGSGTDEGSGGR